MDFATFYKSVYLTISPPTLVHLSVGFPQPAPLKCFVFGAKLSIFSKNRKTFDVKNRLWGYFEWFCTGDLVVALVHYD